MGVLTVSTFAAVYLYAVYNGGELPDLIDFSRVWESIGRFIRSSLGEHFLLTVFAGLWFGAASHTLTDVAGSFMKTGRIAKFL